MSLAEKFEKYLLEAGKDGQRLFGFEDLQRALYFGAEAGLQQCAQTGLIDFTEIADFRSHK